LIGEPESEGPDDDEPPEELDPPDEDEPPHAATASATAVAASRTSRAVVALEARDLLAGRAPPPRRGVLSADILPPSLSVDLPRRQAGTKISRR
jgi:hypothetical protein